MHLHKTQLQNAPFKIAFSKGKANVKQLRNDMLSIDKVEVQVRTNGKRRTIITMIATIVVGSSATTVMNIGRSWL